MVNAKNLVSGGVIALAVAAIVTYMSVNGLTTEDVTLVDACYRASQVKGINTETCAQLKEQNYEWDTQIPCVDMFKIDVYYWTPRMMFAYFSGGKSDVAKLGRKNKGSEEIVYTSAMNMTFAEALADRCDPATADEEYIVYRAIVDQIRMGVKVEDLDLSELEDRQLYSWNQALSWIVSAIGGAIQAIWAAATQAAADAVNYKACSVGLALKFTSSNLIDRAECSGNHPTRCRRYHSSGPSGWWTNHSRGGNNRLNNGCNTHDKCLQNIDWSDQSYSDKVAGKACDLALSKAGKKGINWKWPGFSCGWRGCRSWWFAWSYSVSDSRLVSACVWISMAAAPNGP